MPRPKSNKDDKKIAVVVYPPTISITTETDRYNVCFEIRWGNFLKKFTVSRESNHMIWQMLDELNKALLEGSETNPYITK